MYCHFEMILGFAVRIHHGIDPMTRRRTGSICIVLLAGAFANGPGARAQSLIETLSTTYNGNPDLLAQRAVLRQTDETLAQAVANWRPKVQLSVEYNKIEFDSVPIARTNTYF